MDKQELMNLIKGLAKDAGVNDIMPDDELSKALDENPEFVEALASAGPLLEFMKKEVRPKAQRAVGKTFMEMGHDLAHAMFDVSGPILDENAISRFMAMGIFMGGELRRVRPEWLDWAMGVEFPEDSRGRRLLDDAMKRVYVQADSCPMEVPSGPQDEANASQATADNP